MAAHHCFAEEPHVRNWFHFCGYSAAVEQRMNILTACHMTVSQLHYIASVVLLRSH